MKRIDRTLADALESLDLWDGDVLLFRPSGWIGRLVAAGSQSEYSHAAMVGFWSVLGQEPRAMVMETRELYGARCNTLKSQVAKHPGGIDVYRVNPHMRPSVGLNPAIAYMRDASGQDYGYGAVIDAAFRHLPWFRWFVTPNTDDDALDDRMPFCSQLVAQALAKVGLDPAKNRPNHQTEPADLARSVLFEYQYTLSGVGQRKPVWEPPAA